MEVFDQNSYQIRAIFEQMVIILNLAQFLGTLFLTSNTDSVQNIQFVLNKNEIVANPQSIELLETTNDTKQYSRSYGIDESQYYYKPVEYSSATTFSKLDYTAIQIVCRGVFSVLV